MENPRAILRSIQRNNQRVRNARHVTVKDEQNHEKGDLFVNRKQLRKKVEDDAKFS